MLHIKYFIIIKSSAVWCSRRHRTHFHLSQFITHETGELYQISYLMFHVLKVIRPKALKEPTTWGSPRESPPGPTSHDHCIHRIVPCTSGAKTKSYFLLQFKTLMKEVNIKLGFF